MKNRRVLVLVGGRDTSFYGTQGLSICRALGRIGASAVHIETPHVSEIKRKLPPGRILDAIRTHGCTDALAINIPPGLAIPEAEVATYTDTERKTTNYGLAGLPYGFRWHTWRQDAYDAQDHLPQRHFETRWNWVKRWGEPYLQPATDYGRFLAESDGYDYDVSFIGYLPDQPLAFMGADPRLTMNANIVYEEVLRFLAEDPDGCHYRTDPDSLETLWRRAEDAVDVHLPEDAREGCRHYLGVTGVRFAQRTMLMRKVVDICRRRKWRLALAGMGWNTLEEFAPYSIGHCISGEMAAHLSRRSAISLHCNGEVLYHNRLLETFACGAFCLSWCPGDSDSEGLDVPLFCMADVEERLVYWMEHEFERRAETARIGEVVRRDHTFEHRMRQMLEGRPKP